MLWQGSTSNLKVLNCLKIPSHSVLLSLSYLILLGLYIYTTHLLPKQGENYVEGAPIRMDYVIRRVISEDATKRKFQDADGVETTVAKYFKNHYNITLRSL